MLSCSKKIPVLRGITLKYHSDCYSFVTENKLESHKKVCENKGL